MLISKTDKIILKKLSVENNINVVIIIIIIAKINAII